MSGTLFSGPGPSVRVLSTVPRSGLVTPCPALGLQTHHSAFHHPLGRPANPCPALAPQTRRSAFQCLQQYQQHNPALKRKEWTEEEDRVLTRLVQAMRVGSHIPYRRSESRARQARPWSQLAGRGEVLCRPGRLRSVLCGQCGSSLGDPGSSAPTSPLCLQLSTTWRGGTPCSSSTAGPRAWTPA